MANAGNESHHKPGDENGPWRLRLDYNSPVILTFTLLCGLIFILDRSSSGWFSLNLFSISLGFTLTEYVHYPKLVGHVFGHASAQHLTLNLSIFDPQPFHHPAGRPHTGRKIRPLAVADHDCHYGATALATGLLHVLFFSYGLLGASGIAFMLILLSSFANAKAGTIPLTFVLILILYLGNEFLSSANEDNISHFAHILGGICGSLFGFFKSWNLPPRRMED